MQYLTILGSTGSIGKQTLEVVSWFPDKFKVSALSANIDVDTMAEQCFTYRPTIAVMQNIEAADKLRILLAGTDIKVLSGMEGLVECATLPEVSIVVTAVSGAVGIRPTLAAIKAGKTIALANKETLVAAGDIVMSEARKNNVKIIPVDSEHSAIFQCMGHGKNIRKIILTASGGPFRGLKEQDLMHITKTSALKHPNWAMGAKITIDSATLMNKGLEVIEAYYLFGLQSSQIEVLVHPQSIIHSMVEYGDGSIFAHMGRPDMRIPIQYALSYPDRLDNELPAVDLAGIGKLTFEKPDTQTFKALDLAYFALKEGGTIPAVLNAANEVLVNAFLVDKCSFLGIVDKVEKIMQDAERVKTPTLEEIFAADNWARVKALEAIGG